VKGTRWLAPMLIGAFVVGCAEQEAADEMETDTLQADTTAAAPMTAPVGDTSSADLAVWNTDADARLAPDEFDGWLEEHDFYGQWNTDGEEGLSAQEFGAGLVAVLDGNDDDSVGSAEWEDAGGAWTGDAALSDWDTSGDGALTEDEIVAGVQDSATWSQWDQDGNGTVDEAEFNQAVFGAWDANGDGYVDETEWSANFDAWS
jgi:hypothetical protein